MGGFCLGTVEVAGEVSCAGSQSDVTCSTSQGCTPGVNVCGINQDGISGGINCDGPSDCPANYDCCAGVGNYQMCQPQAPAGVVGSGCAAVDPNLNGPQASMVCDPLTPTSCPTGKLCTAGPNGLAGFACQ
jgi:hypothetical protein